MDNEQESQELDRAYQEYAQVQEQLEKAAQETAKQMAAEGEAALRMVNHFIAKLFA
jgi:N-acetylglutamate synthase/N-acetylornithine aminotransferase